MKKIPTKWGWGLERLGWFPIFYRFLVLKPSIRDCTKLILVRLAWATLEAIVWKTPMDEIEFGSWEMLVWW